MSEGSQTNLAIKKEAVWGEKETGQYTSVNFDSEDFNLDTKREQAKNVRSDRQSSGLITKKEMAVGGFESEFRANDYDDLLKAFLFSADWVSPGTLAGTVDFAIETSGGVGGIITFDAGDTIDIVKDQYIKLPGAIAPANQLNFRVKAVVGNAVQVYSPLVTEAGTTTTVKGDRIRNGILKSSYSIEKQFIDISQYIPNFGMSPNVMEMAVEAEESIMINFSFIGKGDEISDESSSSPVAIPISEEPVFTTGDNVGIVEINSSVLPACLLQSFDFSFDNKSVEKMGVGSIGPCGVDGKTIALTGTMTMFFTDATYYTIFKNASKFSFSSEFIGPNGDIYILRFPSCQFTEAPTNVTGKEDDVLTEGAFEASAGTEGYTMQICRMLA